VCERERGRERARVAASQRREAVEWEVDHLSFLSHHLYFFTDLFTNLVHPLLLPFPLKSAINKIICVKAGNSLT